VILGHLVVVFSALYQLMDECHPESLWTTPVNLINPADNLFEYTFSPCDEWLLVGLVSFRVLEEVSFTEVLMLFV